MLCANSGVEALSLTALNQIQAVSPLDAGLRRYDGSGECFIA